MTTPAYSHTYKFGRLGVGGVIALDPSGAPYASFLDVPAGWTANLWYNPSSLASPFTQAGWVQLPAGEVPTIARTLAVQIEAAPGKTPSQRVCLKISSDNYKSATGLRYTDSGGNRGAPFSGAQTFTLALSRWDYQGVLADGTEVTNLNGGVDLLGQPIRDNSQGGGRVDDGADIPIKPGWGWHLSGATPPSPGNYVILSSNFALTGDWTLEGWTAFDNANGGRHGFTLANEDVAVDTEVVECILSSNNDTIDFAILDDAGGTIYAPAQVAIPGGVVLDTWYHMALTFDASEGVYSVFLDGVRLFQSPTSTAAPPDPAQLMGWRTEHPSAGGAATETRLSNVIRYTGATYTVPSAPFTVD